MFTFLRAIVQNVLEPFICPCFGHGPRRHADWPRGTISGLYNLGPSMQTLSQRLMIQFFSIGSQRSSKHSTFPSGIIPSWNPYGVVVRCGSPLIGFESRAFALCICFFAPSYIPLSLHPLDPFMHCFCLRFQMGGSPITWTGARSIDGSSEAPPHLCLLDQICTSRHK